MRTTRPAGKLAIMRSWTLALVLCLLSVMHAGCEPDGGCASGDAPTVTLGHLVNDAFARLADGEDVDIIMAPQGGYGVAVDAQTTGLFANQESRSTIHVVTEVDGASAGEFVLYQQSIVCDGEHGIASGIVVGIDPNRYGSSDALQVLDGVLATLVVDIVDQHDTRGHGEQQVTLQVSQ